MHNQIYELRFIGGIQFEMYDKIILLFNVLYNVLPSIALICTVVISLPSITSMYYGYTIA